MLVSLNQAHEINRKFWSVSNTIVWNCTCSEINKLGANNGVMCLSVWSENHINVQIN